MTYLEFCTTFGFIENGLFCESTEYSGLVDTIILPPHISIAGQLFPNASYSDIMVIATAIYQASNQFDCKPLETSVDNVSVQFEMSVNTQRLYEIYNQYSVTNSIN